MSDPQLPAALGFRLPAEWEPHAATWIAWPHERSDWPGKFEPIPWVYGEVVRHLTAPGGERVRILVDDSKAERRAKKILKRVGADLAQVDFYRHPTDRAWTRDYCPMWIRNAQGEVALTQWKFNGWAKYPNHKHDSKIGRHIAKEQGRKSWRPAVDDERIVLEGGAIDTNGRGLLLTTEECLLSEVQARNPQLGRAQLEALLGDYLGVKKILWLGEGIVGDDTHGHVDDLCRFVDERTVVLASEPDPRDDNHARLLDNRRRLSLMTDLDGRALEIVELPMPRPLILDGQRLPASYANFYIGNRAVLVPTFNDPADRVACATLARLFPTRTIVGIHAVDLVWGLGTLHCMTHEEPA